MESNSSAQGLPASQERGPEPVYDVFLSYNSRDRKAVRRIAAELEKRGLRVFGDWKIPSGGLWLLELEKVIPQVRVAVFFVGPSGLGQWHDMEREAFHIRKARIIPVLLPGVPSDFEAPLFLQRHSWIDFRTERITKREIDRLVEGILVLEPLGPERRDAAAAPAEPGAPAARRGPLPLRRSLLLAALALALLAAGVWTVLRWQALPPAAPGARAVAAKPSRWTAKVPLPRPSVAVLGFENLSSGKDLDWLGTALAEVVAAGLGIGGAVCVTDREGVALLENDLLLPRKAEVAAPDLSRIRRALGVGYVIAGGYAPVAGPSAVRLEINLYDAEKGRRVAQVKDTGEVASWLELAVRMSGTGDASLRRQLRVAPLDLEQTRHLRTLFPPTLAVAKLYAQGLERYRNFDAVGTADLLRGAAQREPNPLLLATLGKLELFLGRSREAAAALAKAKALDLQAQGTPRALTGEEKRQVEVIERRVALDWQGAAQSAEALFREYFPDDPTYGLLAVDALVKAGSAGDALLLIGELRELPSARGSSSLDRAEADALFAQQSYGPARKSAERAVAEAREIGAVREEALARMGLAAILLETGEAPRAEEQLQLARAGFERTKDLRGVAQSIQLKALLYSNLDLDTAEGLFREAIKRFEALGDRRQEVGALFGLSAALARKGDEAGAQESSRQAALIGGSYSSLAEGLAEFNDGVRLHFAGQLTAAQGRYQAARTFFDRLGERDYYATTLANLGEIEAQRGQLKNAADLCRQALEIHEAEGAVEGAAFDNVCLGKVQAATGNYIAARPRYEMALRSLTPSSGGAPKEPETQGEALLGLAELSLQTGKTGEAEQHARQAAAMAEGANLPALRSRAGALLARVLLAQGKRDEARKTMAAPVSPALGDFRAVREAAIARARVRAAAGEVDPALAELRTISAECAKAGTLVYELESLLAAGEIELEDGRINPARRRLEEVQARAAALGFGQMEKRAAAALGG